MLIILIMLLMMNIMKIINTDNDDVWRFITGMFVVVGFFFVCVCVCLFVCFFWGCFVDFFCCCCSLFVCCCCGLFFFCFFFLGGGGFVRKNPTYLENVNLSQTLPHGAGEITYQSNPSLLCSIRFSLIYKGAIIGL